MLIENATTRDQIDHIEKQLKVCGVMMFCIDRCVPLLQQLLLILNTYTTIIIGWQFELFRRKISGK